MFRTGDTVIFDPDSFREPLQPQDIDKWYRKYYYCDPLVPADRWKPILFTFICEHHPQNGHCILMKIKSGALLSMCHISDFRLATEEEC
jgi:hypothetical protein